MELKLNGKTISTTAGTVMDLVSEQQADPAALVVAVNLSVVTEEKWQEHVLKSRDAVEFLQFVGGG